MSQLNRHFTPCIVDQKCLARNIIYFSFLIPLHHQIVYDFVIGCATGQSCFVAIEKRCNCLIWASIPYETILAGYCLFEVLVDRSKGGTFSGCQNILDQLFKSVRFSNKFTVNRLPYNIEKDTNPQRKTSFVSTLKKLFKVTNFCNISTTDINKFRRGESANFKRAILTNSEKMPKWAERLFNTRNFRIRCMKTEMVPEYAIEGTNVDLIYAQQTIVPNEMYNYKTNSSSDNSIKNTFTASMNEEPQQILIDIDILEEYDIDNRKVHNWKDASVISVGKTNTLNTLEALIVTDALKDPVNSTTRITDETRDEALQIIRDEIADLAFLSPTMNIHQNINRGCSDEEVELSVFPERFENNIAPTISMNDPLNISHYTPTVNIEMSDKFEQSDHEITSAVNISNPTNKNFITMTDNDLPDNKLRESELFVKLSSRAMMNAASQLHQCGLITGSRVTPKIEDFKLSNYGHRTDENKMISSIPDEELEKMYTQSISNKETNISQFSNLCSSTSNTERFMSPKLVNSMEYIEVRDQLWTPVPLSDHDLISNVNNASNGHNYGLVCRMSDWEQRLRCTMEKCMAKQLL